MSVGRTQKPTKRLKKVRLALFHEKSGQSVGSSKRKRQIVII